MKLTKDCIDHLKATQKTRLKLAMELGVTEDWVNRLIAKNQDNSSLTLAAAIEVIQEESGMGYYQIVEKDTVEDVKVA